MDPDDFVQVGPKRFISFSEYARIRRLGVPHEGVSGYLERELSLARRIMGFSLVGKPLKFQEKDKGSGVD